VRVLGIETSCDETGVAIYDTRQGLVAHALHSQVEMHARFGGVVPELASRDHVRRLVPLVESVAASAGMALRGIDAIAYTRGPGLAGALLVGAGLAHALGYALDRPVIGIHHLEGHLLSPLLATPAPTFPFVALLVSGGHSQFHDVRGVGDYRLLGETQDDAAGEAFDKTATLLGLPYPGGPALAKLAERGRAGIYVLPRPMIDAPGLDMSFSGLKTAVRTLVHKLARRALRRRGARRRRARVRGCDRRRAGGEVARRARRDRALDAGRRRRRRRQPAIARATCRRRRRARRSRSLSGRRVLHRQRRDDRARRRAQARRSDERRRRVRRAPALAARRSLTAYSRPITRSSPRTSLRMFSRCRQNTSTAITTITNVTGTAPSS